MKADLARFSDKIYFVERCKRLLKNFLKATVIIGVFVAAFEFLSPSLLEAQTYCPDQRVGEPALSELATEPGAFKERDVCEGFFGQIGCWIRDVIYAIYGTLADPYNAVAEFDNSAMPAYLRLANQLLLSINPEVEGEFDAKRQKPSGISGSLAKLTPPEGYDYGGKDALLNLYKAEGELVSGTAILNSRNKQFDFTGGEIIEAPESSNPGWYQSLPGGEDYDVPARFGEVAPLYDRYGVLRQALFIPGVEEAEIPDKDCPAYDKEGKVVYDPTPIDVIQPPNPDPDWDAKWQATEVIGKEESNDPDCDNDPATYEDGICSDRVSAEEEAGGNLDTNSEVSFAGKAWERIGAPTGGMPGEGGVYNVLLFPGQSFLTADAKEPRLPYFYDTQNPDAPDHPGSAPLYIADLGNVQGAVGCIVNQLTAHPANAAYGTCEAAFGISEIGGIPGTCTDEVTPISFDNSSSSPVARQAWEIVNKLYQGFWCLWNKKLEPPPQVFDQARFDANPNPSRSEIENCWTCLYWCTFLIHDVLPASVRGTSGNSDTMAKFYGATGTSPNFGSGGRFISADDATSSNIAPGYVVFFDVHNSLARTDHVGLVYSVSSTSITFIQSNSGSKEGVITFNAVPGDPRPGVQDLPWAYVTGFGRP